MVPAPNRCRTAPVLAVLLCSIVSTTALAQPGSAYSTFFNPSIESSGMGYASVAVAWQDDLNDWANPALLGYQKGIRYSYGNTRLIPDFADDVHFKSDRLAIGAWGVGLSIVGKPVEGIGRLLLDYGPSFATDMNGNVIGTFDSREVTRQIGVGVSLVQLFENVIAATGGRPSRVSRYGDISLGHAWKHVDLELAPPNIALALPGRGEAHTKDLGALLRVTPVGAMGRGPVKIDISGGFSERNYGDAYLHFTDGSGDDRIYEERLFGAAAHLSYTLNARPGGIWDFLSPTLAVGGAWERTGLYFGGSGQMNDTRTGQEISILGLVSLRHGFYGDFDGETWGYSVGLQYRGMAGVRYDWAEVPESPGLSDLHRQGITAFFDPYRLYRAVSPGPESVASSR